MVLVMVQGVVFDSKTGTPVVVLREVKGARMLPIWVGPGEASAIAMRLEAVKLEHGKPRRPLTHDLAASFVTALGGRVATARIHNHEGSTYFAEVVLERDGEAIAVDSRPSDAIAIALRTGAEIVVADHLFRSREESAKRKSRSSKKRDGKKAKRIAAKRAKRTTARRPTGTTAKKAKRKAAKKA